MGNPATASGRVRRALVSVSDKRGLVDLGALLQRLGVEILSTGGTARALAEAGIRVTQVSEHTGAATGCGGCRPDVEALLGAC